MRYPEAHKVKGTIGVALDDVFCALEYLEERHGALITTNMGLFYEEVFKKALEIVENAKKETFNKLPLYKREFFHTIEKHGLEELPDFLRNGDWKDQSWHNDEMPSWFNKKLGVTLWVNFKNKVNSFSYAYALEQDDKETREFIKELGEFYDIDSLKIMLKGFMEVNK